MIPLSLYQSKERCGSMKYADRSGHIHGRENTQDKLLRTLYNSLPGCLILKPLVHPCISRIGGYFLDSPLSTFLIRPFVRSSGISLRGCETPAGGAYRSFNAFFTRSLKETARPFSQDPDILCSPCDGLVSAYPISRKQHLSIKHTDYTVSQLLRDDKLASRYMGGTALVFRLTVSDYHRYAYIDSGLRSSYRRIPGVLHTVNPAAAVCRPVYKENTREYSLLRSRGFGTVLMMEVEAMMVGKIVNHHKAYTRLDVFRGQEQGYFAFGGSTVILLFEPGQATVDKDILRNTALDIETKVKMGEAIGRRP